ncbi:MAG: hypothetical protein M3389_06765, partial [Actinomycetota bacterium]|nr:hypothetical protein [Actinomycetota bacterium]
MPDGPRNVVVAFHLADPSGPSRSLEPILERLAQDAAVTIAVPERGRVAEELRPLGRIATIGHAPLI